MDGALVLVALVSLGTTGAVLLYAARLIRDERARSDARVSALAEEIGRGAGGPPARAAERAPLSPAPVTRRAAADALGDRPLVPTRDTTAEPGDRVRGRSGGMLFDSGGAPDTASARWLVPAIGAAIVVLALSTVYFVSGPASSGEPSARPAEAASQAPLELVSLQHGRKGTALTVSGVVRNPAGAAARREVSAVVFLFGRDGSFLASGRAPLDYQALAAGDESPFTISVPDAGDVSRYRVSFRAGDDVLPHVDRREPGDRANRAATRP